MRLIAIIALVTMSGCYVNLDDKTPPAFPADVARDAFGVPSGQAAGSWYLSGAENHRFKLTVGAGHLVRNIRAFATVDGQEHPMSETPNHLFHFDALNKCRAAHNYSYRVTYSALGQSKTKRWPANGSTKRVSVTRFGDVIWFLPNGTVHYLGDGTESIRLVAQTNAPQVLTLRNLSASPLDLYNIGLAAAVGAANNDQFSVTPTVAPSATSPVRLNCGDDLRVSIDWKAPTPGASATGALSINGMLSSDNSGWNLLLILHGVPHPP